MERAVWVCACAFALSLAVGISSMSSATSSADNPSKSFELTTCKTKSTCVEPHIKPIERTGEMFLRKVKRASRKAYA